MYGFVSQVLVTIYWLGKAANSCASYSGTTLNLKEFEGLLAQMRKVTWLLFFTPCSLDKVAKRHICLFLRSLQFHMVELHQPKMPCAQGNDHLSSQWHLCIVHPTPTWMCLLFSKFSLSERQTAKELSACFLGGRMPESNRTVSYRNGALLYICPEGHAAYSSGPSCGWDSVR